MIKFDSLRQYTHIVDGVRYPQNNKSPFIIVYFSENSTLLKDYSKLNIKLIDAKYVIIPVTKIPISRLNNEIKIGFKSLGLKVLSSTQKIPTGQNFILDLSIFLNSIDENYNPSNYRQRSGFLIQNILQKIFSSYPSNYRKVLLYSIDSTKELSEFINRKIFSVFMQLKDDQFYFDHMIFSNLNFNDSRHKLLIKDRKFKLSRIKNLLKNVKLINNEFEKEEEVKKVTNVIMSDINDIVEPKNKKKIKNSIQKFISLDKESREKLSDDIDNKKSINKNISKELATAAILHQTNGNINKSKRIANSIPSEKKTIVLKNVDKKYADELLERKKPKTQSTDIIIQISNVEKAVGNKSPEHLFEKRKIDFEKNLKKDLTNSFKVLYNKEIPLKVTSVDIKEKISKKGELYPSDVSVVHVKLEDKRGKVHKIKLDIPNIQEDGTFKVSGRKKCLIHQLVLCPITFPKQYDSKFESSYSAFHINSKRTKRENHLQIFIGSYKLPISIVMFFSFGFEETLKQFDIKYEYIDIEPKKEQFYTAIEKKKYIIFKNINSTLKEEFAKSFTRHDISKFKINQDFGTKLFWNDVILKITGRIDSTFRLQSNLDNIVDPVAKQVLINKQLPYKLDQIMYYMARKTVEGFHQSRNDVSNQRIRNSEVIVHLAQKQILAAYTEYKEKVLSGNIKADFEISETKIMSDFINSEIVTDMEYANPAEEMSTKTRVSPVGKSIGGIPDKGAISNEGRDVHNSMYGNIDTLDTPEGDNIGIVQHLTIDSYITSARGLIIPKDMKDGEDSGLLSTAASMIPFVENNDGARVMFGCNQSRQSVPLKKPEPPGVQSGYESILSSMLSSAFIKKSPCDGKIIDITHEIIKVKCNTGKIENINIEPEHLRSGSGKNTLSVFKSIVEKGQSIKKDKIIAEGSCMNQGTISMGRDLCVALIPWKGYNFEDGIVISDALIKNEKLTSLHGEVEEVLISENDRLLYINEIDRKTEKGEPLIRRTIGEVEELLGFEENEDEDIFSGQYIKKSPGGIIVDIEVFANISLEKYPQLKFLSDKTIKKYKKPPKEKFSIKGVSIKGILIRFKIEQELPIGIGDKLTNRHGAKGIVSLIEKEENMPITPWGERVEIITNPIGVINRMNMGQYYELYCGLISKELGTRILKLKDINKITKLLNTVLPLLDETKNKDFSNNLILNISKLSSVKFKNLLSQMEENKRFPIIIPPFKAPNYTGIMKALKILDLKTGYKLKITEYNTTTKALVPVGYQYFLKLEHLGSEKAHSRSTGIVVSKTNQPTAGKKRDGGQRMGEMDTYSLISYNSPIILSEFFGPLSDDSVTKNEMINNIIQKGSTEFIPAKYTPGKDLLNAYFTALCLEKK